MILRPPKSMQSNSDASRPCIITKPYPVHSAPLLPHMQFIPSTHHNVVDGGGTRSRMGRKLPTINAGLRLVSSRPFSTTLQVGTYISYMSRLTVKEKQHLISGSLDFGSGFLREQLVRIAFCELSKAMAPNFSQYDTSEGSAMIS